VDALQPQHDAVQQQPALLAELAVRRLART
jgi:hypothetical protein